jgi:hypothetical protein
LSSLPNELKEAVIDLIDDTPDILSLALSCRTLHNHIISRHLYYRDVSCSQEGFNGFMEALSTSPECLKNVRHMHIGLPSGDGRTRVLPGLPETQSTAWKADSVDRLCHLLSCMPYIRSFTLASARFTSRWFPKGADELWAVLTTKCTLLHTLDMHDGERLAPGGIVGLGPYVMEYKVSKPLREI